jgi:hypothetical protein
MQPMGLAIVAIIAVGCGGASRSSGSCKQSSASVSGCDEFSAPSEQIGNLKQNCTTGGGTWSDGPCSRANALGGCELVDGDVTTTQWFYQSGSASSADMVKAYCQQNRATFVTP